MRRIAMTPLVLLLGATAPAPPSLPPEIFARWCGDAVDSGEKIAVLPGYGPGGFAIRTKSPEAQAFFTNGMQLGRL